MGVPLATRLGDRHRSRMSASVLSNMNRRDWIAENEREFVEKVCDIVGQIKSIDRNKIREDFLNAPFSQPQAFTKVFETHLYSLLNPTL